MTSKIEKYVSKLNMRYVTATSTTIKELDDIKQDNNLKPEGRISCIACNNCHKKKYEKL